MSGKPRKPKISGQLPTVADDYRHLIPLGRYREVAEGVAERAAEARRDYDERERAREEKAAGERVVLQGLLESILHAVREPPAPPPASGSRSKKPGRKPSARVDGQRLKEYRGERSQDWLATEAGISIDTVQRGEANEPWSEPTFDAVASALSKELRQTITADELKL